MAVKIVKGKAFFTNILKPKLKSFFLSSSRINVMLCRIECKKQKYSVNAKRGEK